MSSIQISHVAALGRDESIHVALPVASFASSLLLHSSLSFLSPFFLLLPSYFLSFSCVFIYFLLLPFDILYLSIVSFYFLLTSFLSAVARGCTSCQGGNKGDLCCTVGLDCAPARVLSQRTDSSGRSWLAPVSRSFGFEHGHLVQRWRG